MENNVSKWFDAAKRVEPVMSVEEVEAMISQTPKGGFSTLQKGIFMVTVIGVILSLMIWITKPSLTDPETSKSLPSGTVQQLETFSQPIENQLQATTEQPTRKKRQTKHEEQQVVVVDAKDDEPQTDFTPTFSFSFNGLAKQQTTSGSFNPDEIVLTNEELLKLGIRTDGNVLDYLNRYDSSEMHFDFNPKETMVFAMVLQISQSGGSKTNNVHPLDSNLLKYSNSAVPLIVTRISDEENAKESNTVLHLDIPPTKESVFIKTMLPKLIPIKVKTKGRGVLYVHDNTIIFWYKNNQAFRDKLPSSIAASLAQQAEFSEQELSNCINELKKQSKEAENLSKPDVALVKLKQAEFIELSKSELKQLNIRFNGKNLDYKVFSHDLDSNLVVIDLKASPDLFMLNSNHRGKKKVKLKQTPLFAWYITDSSLNIDANFIDPLSQVGDQEANEQRLLNQGQLFQKRMDQLVPVVVRFTPEAVKKAKFKHPSSHLVFWFPETEAFIKALPERIQKQLGVNISSLNRTQATPLKYIELTDEQLDKLGIKRNPESITVPMHTGNGKYMFSDYSSKGTVIHFNSMTSTTGALKSPSGGIKFQMKQGESVGTAPTKLEPPKYAYPSPLLITEGNGLHWLTYQTDEDMSKEDQEYMIQNGLSPLEYKPMLEAKKRGEEKLAAALNTYIALKVKSNEKPSGERNPDLIIWYKPDSLFFAALPNELSAQIQQELKHLNLEQSESGCQFFEACQSVKGTIEQCIVYPNPTTGPIQIKMELLEPRRVSIFLTDISGKKVKDLMLEETLSKGAFERQLTLEGLAEGMYLVHVITNKGEYIVQRVIRKE